MRKRLINSLLAISLATMSCMSFAEIITFDDVDEELFVSAGESFSENGFTLLVNIGEVFSINDAVTPSPSFNSG
ncbi:hypothetical protein PN836_001035 [Ningiella sp. W23]|uniref:hypothetical protein n=1 Tax=Ningiella sp. W23 TaxID=3023715 RepID=UPI0037582D72